MEEHKKHRGFRDLKVYQLAYRLAMEIFEETKHFPVGEKHGLTSQLRRSSRSVPANIAEAWKKRIYSKAFVNKLVDSSGEAGETEVWLDMALDSGYLTKERHKDFLDGYEEIGKMLYGMITQPEKFCT